MTEQEKQRLNKLFDKYWDSEEINIDLANQLVDMVPKLLRALDERDRELDAWKKPLMVSSTVNRLAEEIQRLRKALEDITESFDHHASLEIARQALAGEEKEAEFPCQGCGKELGTEWEKYCVVCQLHGEESE